MRIWTAHEKPHAAPLLLREGISVGAALFGPFWLAAHRAWVPAGVTLLLLSAIPAVTRPPAALVLVAAVAVLSGLSGRDMVRWSVARAGYHETTVVAARTEDEAQARLLAMRPDLVRRTMAAETGV